MPVAADTVPSLLQAEGQALLEELLDPTERGNRGEGWVVAQLAAVAFLLFPPAVLRTLVNDSGAALMVVGIVTLCALLCTMSSSPLCVNYAGCLVPACSAGHTDVHFGVVLSLVGSVLLKYPCMVSCLCFFNQQFETFY